MALNKKHRGKVTLENFDDCLMYTGYLLPENDRQLDNFNKLYEDYNFELNNVKINVEAIVNGNLSCCIKKTRVLDIREEDADVEIQNLRMIARKGEEIPQDIIDKMKKKHRPKDNDEK